MPKKDQTRWTIYAEKKTRPRNGKGTVARGWIVDGTKIGPVLDITICRHQDRYGIEILVESLFRDGTASWVNRYVTETSEISDNTEHRAAGKPVATARPRLKPAVTLSSVSIPLRDRKWIDINPEKYDHDCFSVSKAMIRLLRQGQSVNREKDGAVRFVDILEEFKKKFDGALQWPISDLISILAKRGGQKKRFQYCLNPNSSQHFLYFRAIQGHSGGNALDPELQDNVPIPENFTKNIYHVRNVSAMYSIINKWTGRKKSQKGKSISIFTALNLMDCDDSTVETPRDLTKPRITPYKKYLETSSKYGILVQFETRSRERIAILPNAVACNRPLQHTACNLHWQRGMHEDKGGAVSQSMLGGAVSHCMFNSKITACCAPAELVRRSTRSTRTRRKKIRGPLKRIIELQGNLEQQRGLQYIWHTSFCSRKAGYKSEWRSQDVDTTVWESPE